MATGFFQVSNLQTLVWEGTGIDDSGAEVEVVAKLGSVVGTEDIVLNNLDSVLVMKEKELVISGGGKVRISRIITKQLRRGNFAPLRQSSQDLGKKVAREASGSGKKS